MNLVFIRNKFWYTSETQRANKNLSRLKIKRTNCLLWLVLEYRIVTNTRFGLSSFQRQSIFRCGQFDNSITYGFLSDFIWCSQIKHHITFFINARWVCGFWNCRRMFYHYSIFVMKNANVKKKSCSSSKHSPRSLNTPLAKRNTFNFCYIKFKFMFASHSLQGFLSFHFSKNRFCNPRKCGVQYLWSAWSI